MYITFEDIGRERCQTQWAWHLRETSQIDEVSPAMSVFSSTAELGQVTSPGQDEQDADSADRACNPWHTLVVWRDDPTDDLAEQHARHAEADGHRC